MEHINLYEEVKKLCADTGVTVSDLCRAAGISNITVYKWKNQNPETINKFNQLIEAANKIKQNEVTN